MLAHQAVGVTDARKPFDLPGQQGKDTLPCVAADGAVVERTGYFKSTGAAGRKKGHRDQTFCFLFLLPSIVLAATKLDIMRHEIVSLKTCFDLAEAHSR